MATFICTSTLVLAAGSVPAADTPDGLGLLKQSGERYRAAKTYRIEHSEETNTSTGLSRSWEKSTTTAVQGADNRFRYEVRSEDGTSIRISDGKTEWVYHVEANAYLQHPAAATGPQVGEVMMPADLVEFHAIKIRDTLADAAGKYKSAKLLPEESLTFAGRPVLCYVVKIGEEDLAKPGKTGSVFEKTVWIDKSTLAVRKIVVHERRPRMMSPATWEEVNTVEEFPVAELDGKIPDEVFTFNPPQTAALVEKFKSPFAPAGEDLTGKQAPSLSLKSLDGKEVSLASLRGKPVLVDFWATWCLPCVASMPQMAELQRQTKDKGLVFLSVDEDEDAKKAASFLADRHESWPNFHDTGDIGKAFGKSALPYTVLIDQQGKIVFSKVGYSDDSLSDLRAAIAKLGSEFTSIAQAAASPK
ncbi:MAG TPA: redoxin family protein [Candidatus Acidoferrum sp.]